MLTLKNVANSDKCIAIFSHDAEIAKDGFHQISAIRKTIHEGSVGDTILPEQAIKALPLYDRFITDLNTSADDMQEALNLGCYQAGSEQIVISAINKARSDARYNQQIRDRLAQENMPN
jgi:hypothetical protein